MWSFLPRWFGNCRAPRHVANVLPWKLIEDAAARLWRRRSTGRARGHATGRREHADEVDFCPSSPEAMTAHTVTLLHVALHNGAGWSAQLMELIRLAPAARSRSARRDCAVEPDRLRCRCGTYSSRSSSRRRFPQPRTSSSNRSHGIEMDINKPRYTPMSRRRRIYEGGEGPLRRTRARNADPAFQG